MNSAGEDRPFVPLVERAIELAAEWHDGTYRKGRWRPEPFESDADLQVPTMAHVTSVATTVARAGWPEDVVAAAYLHDVLEDPNSNGELLSRDVLEEEVGRNVAELVSTVSENTSDSVTKKARWRVRKEAYISQLAAGSSKALAISLADKIHNLWTINQNLEQHIDPFENTSNREGLSAGPQAQLWFHQEVLSLSEEFDDLRLDSLRKQLQEEIERFASFVGDGDG